VNGQALLEAHAHRRVPLEGAINTRDLGGLPTGDGARTRRGVAYRSDSLASLTREDLARVEALRLRSLIDLRTADERARRPNRLPRSAAISRHAVGFMPRGHIELIGAINARRLTAADTRRAMHEQYRRLALEHTSEFRAVIDALLTPVRTPLVFHCASGKDRTGLAAAIVLLAVGVDRAQVIEDYTLSNYQRPSVDFFSETADPDAVEQVMAADPSYLEAALDAMADTCGSIEGYLAERLGVESATRARLREVLVE
jgi:protein-tyrosine phosphatase